MLGGLLNIPLMGEKTQDTGWGENESETTQQARKKSACLFFTQRQMNVGVNSHAVDQKKKENTRGRVCDR